MEEEEEEHDEEDSSGDLDDVEKFVNEDHHSEVVLEEEEVREVLASAWKHKRQEISKEKLRRGFGRPSKPTSAPATRKFRAEVEELKLGTKCNHRGMVEHWSRECPQKRTQSFKGDGRGNYPVEKEAHCCDWIPSTSRVFCVFFFESKHCSRLRQQQNLAVVGKDPCVLFLLKLVLREGGNLRQSTSLRMRGKQRAGNWFLRS